MRTIIAGGRNITDRAALAAAIAECGWCITQVVCGGAKGVDEMGRQWAMAHDTPVHLVLPDWGTYGKIAGPRRNREMAKVADALILVWDGASRGSASMLREAKAHGLRVYQHIIPTPAAHEQETPDDE